MALDALHHLFPDTIDREIGAALQAEWNELAHRFADEHDLETDASLFSDNRSATLPLLQSALETCARLSPAVSSDARELHHLLDELLHYAASGNGGDLWGLKGFHHVWEAACLKHAITQYGEAHIFTCDTQYSTGIGNEKLRIWKNNQEKVFDKNGIARCPDLVVKKDDGTWLIVDFKYYGSESTKLFKKAKRPTLDLSNLLAHEVKAYQDIANIEAYRWLLMQYELKSADESSVKLELWLPDSCPNEHQCGWMDTLTLVGKPSRNILGDYGKAWRG